MPVVAQVSDLHLSPRVPERQAQAELVVAGINQAKPDLTVVTGDLTDDGWERPEDLVWARDWMDDRLDHEWFAVPGNHDVGNFASLQTGIINSTRVENWDNVFGNRHLTQPGRWTIVGINSMLAGSGLPAEQEQIDWLHKESDNMGYVADSIFFGHSPLSITPIDSIRFFEESIDPAIGYWLGPSEGRESLWHRLNNFATTLYGTGHLHQSRIADDNGRNIVWAPPASGTWVHAPGLPNPPAPERTGFVLHHLGEDGSVRSEVVECAPMLKTVFYDPTGAG